MKKKLWIILICCAILFGILWFLYMKIRSYSKDTYICHQLQSSCTAIIDTDYYYENHTACPTCPTFWEYLIKWIKSLDKNGVINCCSERAKNKPCGCGENVIKNYQECDCSIQ